jgi:CheY-like chemotaxis protein
MNPLKRVLLAEDDSRDVELTLNALSEHNLANEVIVTHDGAEAWDYLTRQGRFAGRPEGNPAVVLLDLKMPKMDGLEVLRRLRAEPSLRAIPVVMLTSSNEERDVLESYKLGVNAYVVKPVAFADFISAVRNLGLFWAVLNQPPPGSVQRVA